MTKPSYLNFDNRSYAWRKGLDYREKSELYKVGKGEQGVLICEPYKSEILPYWRFKTPEIARISSEKIYEMFLNYLKQGEFVGSDMARKYLQMGFTRARRYTNYKGGKKYDAEHNHKQLERGTGDPEKAVSADIFFKKWQEAEENEEYKNMKIKWKEKYG
ncbi:DUF4385 domain-containing protein [Rickettsia endosymbiont of Halotydeus destructor]|uniref:DUF4385 domain-containing protein n=1 Tax=Rickettsia endosymbiont of Halotydeus destructor TaxID=2996754 RepID=UPI003BAEA48E